MGLKYKNLIAAGCSFTANGIGGYPPTLNNEGGCSFCDDPDYKPATPASWASFLAQSMNVTSFVNLASGSHGISLTVNSVVEVLDKFDYKPNNTLIVFNITDPARLDIPCNIDYFEKSKYVPWDHNIISHSYIDRNSEIIKTCQKHQGVEQVEIANSNLLKLFIDSLKYHKFDFYFLLMKDYLEHPTLGQVIKNNYKHLIVLDDHVSMYDYSLKNNLLATDRRHPNIQAHKNISDIVLKTITQEQNHE